ncbi:MAG TPA: aldo/keto reductase [Chthoniobacteraceae bacterium]|jgi:aryl-alcohol dehydrogenase-like predicted oxidoreductase|nr:aldo/keto reductase [Chthoniobacteraceae bacterium]
MKARSLPGTDLKLSTFCCGLGDVFALPRDQWEPLLDTYVEAGGNFFDTAHAYCYWLPGGAGLSEITIGEYVRRRGLKNITIATKGGHPSSWRYRTIHQDRYLSPERIRADIDDSLARLECDTISLYYLHRDDPRVPVSEIVEFLHAEIQRGRIRYLGASNWSAQRIAEANEYARVRNLEPFIISEPRWSLAATKSRPDTADSLSGESLGWHRENHFPAAPYSPTARGFFAKSSGEDSQEYDTPENHQRRERARELARKLNVTPTQVALAWLISQPFPVFPILGTKSRERLMEAFAAEEIALGNEELEWLANG